MSDNIDKAGVARVIPHGLEVIGIDRIIYFSESPGEVVAHSETEITADHCRGHFPGRPILPLCNIIEWAGQLVTYALFRHHNLTGEQMVGLFSGGFVGKMCLPIRPGDCLRLEATVRNWTFHLKMTEKGQRGRGAGQAAVKGFVKDRSAFRFKLTFRAMDWSLFDRLTNPKES